MGTSDCVQCHQLSIASGRVSGVHTELHVPDIDCCIYDADEEAASSTGVPRVDVTIADCGLL